jgi:hypothetical protein
VHLTAFRQVSWQSFYFLNGWAVGSTKDEVFSAFAPLWLFLGKYQVPRFEDDEGCRGELILVLSRWASWIK